MVSALLTEWSGRTHVSVAEIPAGTKVKFMHGRAELKNGEKIPEFRPGGGMQYCFEQFDEAWIKATRGLSE